MSTMDKVCYGIAAIVILLVVGSLAWLGYVMCLGPKMYVQPVLAATPLPHTRVPTVTVPTSTPKATSTPKPPTVTPILPTPVPSPETLIPPMPVSPTAIPTVSAEEEAYLARLYGNIVLWAALNIHLRDMTVDLDDRPGLLMDVSWRSDVRNILVGLGEEGRLLREITAPTRLEEIQEGVVLASECSDRAIELYSRGLDEEDLKAIAEGYLELMLGMVCIEDGMAKFQQESQLK